MVKDVLMILTTIWLLSCSDRLISLKDSTSDKDDVLLNIHRDIETEFYTDDFMDVHMSDDIDFYEESTDIILYDEVEGTGDICLTDTKRVDDTWIVRCPDGGCIGLDIYTCGEITGNSNQPEDEGSKNSYVEQVWEICGGFENIYFYREFSDLTISKRYVILSYEDMFDDTNIYSVFSDVVLYDKDNSTLYRNRIYSSISLASCDSCDFCYIQNSYRYINIFYKDINVKWRELAIGIKGRPIAYLPPMSIDYTDEYVVLSSIYDSNCGEVVGSLITRIFKDIIIWQIYEPIKSLGYHKPIITSNGNIYIFDTDDGLSLNAYSRSGEKIWRRSILQEELYSITYPIVDSMDNIYIIAASKYLISIDSNGNIRWMSRYPYSEDHFIVDFIIGEERKIYAIQHVKMYDSRIHIVNEDGRLEKTVDLKNISYISNLIAIDQGRLLFVAYKEDQNNTGFIEIVILNGNGEIADEIILGKRRRIGWVYLSMDWDGSIYFLSPKISGGIRGELCLYKYRVKGVSLARSPWPMWRADPQNTGRVQKW